MYEIQCELETARLGGGNVGWGFECYQMRMAMDTMCNSYKHKGTVDPLIANQKRFIEVKSYMAKRYIVLISPSLEACYLPRDDGDLIDNSNLGEKVLGQRDSLSGGGLDCRSNGERVELLGEERNVEGNLGLGRENGAVEVKVGVVLLEVRGDNGEVGTLLERRVGGGGLGHKRHKLVTVKAVGNEVGSSHKLGVKGRVVDDEGDELGGLGGGNLLIDTGGSTLDETRDNSLGDLGHEESTLGGHKGGEGREDDEVDGDHCSGELVEKGGEDYWGEELTGIYII